MAGLVTQQPEKFPDNVMDPYRDYLKDNLSCMNGQGYSGHCHSQTGCCERNGSGHNACHRSRRRYIFLFFGLLLLLGILVAGFCAYHSSSEGFSGFWGSASESLGGLLKRAPGDPQNDNGPLIDRKYYLIIVFVGLFIVVILGIMLSAWCCRGAFENPCCCPCYLCACCGGLACLECIGCGLCAAAAEG